MDVELATGANIRLLLMDVDGVLTDGKLYNVPAPDGKMAETKGFDSQDGIALQWLAGRASRPGVISGRLSPATVERARQCKMSSTSTRATSKKSRSWRRFWRMPRSTPAEVAYIGDDFTDVVVMRRVGLAMATANARPEVKRAAHYVTSAPGGEGAVREIDRAGAEGAGALVRNPETLRSRFVRRCA